MNDFLLNNLVRFFTVLRACGIRLSLSESIDAVRALACVALLDKAAVKAALSACIAKREAEEIIFSACFDRFFVDPAERRDYIARETEVREQKQAAIISHAAELRYQDQELDLSVELKEVYAALNPEERRGILEFLERSSAGKNMKPEFKPLTESVIKGKLNELKRKQDESRDHSGQARHDHHHHHHREISEAGIIADDVAESIWQDNSLIYRNLNSIEDEDLSTVLHIIRLMADRLRKKAKRRSRVSGKAGLDFKGTIRAGIASGGTPFRLKYKRKRGAKQRILTLCDVSASMYRFSGFVLKFISCLHAESAPADHFIFSTGTEKLNIRSFTTATDIEREITKSSLWSQGTDISQAIRHILTDRFVILNASTTVIVVSDAKTIHAAEAAAQFKELAAKVKHIYWLNPIHEADWRKIAGLSALRESCVMLDCSNLDKLARACESI